MLIRQPVNNLLGGVSQQSPAVRGIDQCEAQVNFWPSPVDGLMKRPTEEYLAKIHTGATTNYKYHIINRSSTEQYVIQIIDAGVIKVHTLVDIPSTPVTVAGTQLLVNTTTGSSAYLTSTAGPKTDLRIHTEADYTFLLNTTKVPAIDTGTLTASKPTPTEAYIFVRQGNYKTNYKIRIKRSGTDNTVTTATWNGQSVAGAEINSIKTDDIAADLKTKLDAFWGGANPTVTRVGSVLKITGSVIYDAIEPVDSIGDSVLSVVWNQVPRVSAYLPEICTHGFVVKIIGDEEINADDYYVKFVADEGTGIFGRGHWQEDLTYSQPYLFTYNTMPQVLVRIPDPTGATSGVPGRPYFQFRQGPWTNKLVGDTVTNPQPSFVGKTISNIFFYKSRLGFLADDRVIMSEANDPFNFWRTTLLTLLDSELIDVINNFSPVSLAKSAIPYNENLILKSGRHLFALNGGEILSPRTVQIIPIATFENYEAIEPVTGGRSLFFGFKRGDFSGIRELFQVGDSALFDNADVSQQVPHYMPGAVEHMSVSTLEDTLVIKSTSDANSLFVYKYMWNGDQKVISSWGTWDLSGSPTVRYFHFIENILYLVNEYSDGVYVEKITITTGLTDTSANYMTLLDRRTDQSKITGFVYNGGANTSTFTVPYTMPLVLDPLNLPQVVQKVTGTIFPYVSHTGTTVTVTGNLTGLDYWVGLMYAAAYQFTIPIIKLPAGRGLAPETGCIQRVKYLDFQYSSSGKFYVYVTVAGRSPYTYELNNNPLQTGAVVYDTSLLRTDKARIPIHGRADVLTVAIVNPNPFPSNITSAVWEILMYESSKRIA